MAKAVTRGRINTIFGILELKGFWNTFFNLTFLITTGLDPAGPLFDSGSPVNRLDAGDADYVEIIHTDTVALGIGDPIGHVDFYPNGGTGMPGCTSKKRENSIFISKFTELFTASLCDHAIAANYFAETVNSDRLWGRRCSNMAAMNANDCNLEGASMGGEPSQYRNNLRGIYRMPTNAQTPFGQGPF